ncbi:para-nitrobenzyl esterase [Mycobacterium sp. MAA66]|uniref:carboxylesterase/lipase family protein n=1 Tax=Mycobacterium sp. MAA66 TaxID=3156297 RepID=UPI0035115393
MHDRTIRVTVDSGTIEGFTRDGVHRWRAVPFARPPMGPWRYRAPQPVQPWRGVRYCHGFAYCAPQESKFTVLGVGKRQPMSEDCLTLNVAAPEHPSDQPLPVMFFIHGGGYIMGSSATPIYDGAALARRGCIYVSVNYRLGALGCIDLSSLSTPEHQIDGNLFLQDLVAALRWVKTNIAEFGGDPDRVTIFGESAGAHAVATLMAVPSAKGLFCQAISESPASGMVRTPDIAAKFAEQFVGLLGTEPDHGAAALMAAKPSQLLHALDQLIARAGDDLPGAFPAGPACGTDLLPEDPVIAMANGTAHRVPLIVGSNADEGRLFTRFMQLLPTTEPMIEKVLANTGPGVRDRITAAYPGYPRSAEACIKLGGDFAFGSATWQIAEAHSVHAPTYVYRYDYAPRTLHWSGLGATHATELLAVFDVYRTAVGSMLTAGVDRQSAIRVSNDMQNRWRAFAHESVPGDGWPQYETGHRAVMVFDRRTHLEFDPRAEQRRAWEGFELLASAQ